MVLPDTFYLDESRSGSGLFSEVGSGSGPNRSGSATLPTDNVAYKPAHDVSRKYENAKTFVRASEKEELKKENGNKKVHCCTVRYR